MKQALVKPAGHSVIEPRIYGQPSSELLRWGLHWLDFYRDVEEHFAQAEILAKGLQPSVAEAHALVLDPRFSSHKHVDSAGLLLSAIYNESKDHVIVYDLPIALNDLLTKFSVDKVCINVAELGRVGQGVIRDDDDDEIDNFGVFVNLGTTMSVYSGLELINAGTAWSDKWYADVKSGGMMRACWRRQKRIFHSRHLDDEFQNLITDIARSAPDSLIAKYGENPGKSIRERLSKYRVKFECTRWHNFCDEASHD